VDDGWEDKVGCGCVLELVSFLQNRSYNVGCWKNAAWVMLVLVLRDGVG
jgi:hypothetical protein